MTDSGRKPRISRFIVDVPFNHVEDYESADDAAQAIAETLAEYLDFDKVTVKAEVEP